MSIITTTWQARLRRHYQKLNKQLKDKRFQTRSLFQQQRLLARLHRCRMQLRHLAAGAVMTGSLLFGNAAFGQYVPPHFLYGGGGHADYSNLKHIGRGDFVDLDNDGDLDYVTTDRVVGDTVKSIQYYENIGGIDSARYTLVTGPASPLDSIYNVEELTFVDIDGDGDMDCFGRAAAYYRPNTGVLYIENQGTAASPNFVVQPLSNNPLADVVNYYGIFATAAASFVDLDNDGDLDCFVSGYAYYNPTANEKVLYYLNQGSATNPNFVRQSTGNNPLAAYANNLRNWSVVRMEFEDLDKDNDLDVFWSQRVPFFSFSLFNNRPEKTKYYENIGNSANAIFDTATVTPLDSILNYELIGGALFFDDACGDGDIDVILSNGVFYESVDTFPCGFFIGIPLPPQTSVNNQVQIYPNPASSWVQFTQPLSGRLMIYNSLGQLVEQQQLDAHTGLEIQHLPNGWYLLYWRTEDAILQEKIRVQH